MPEGEENITDSQEFKDALTAAVEEKVSGLKANRDTLIAEKANERVRRLELEAKYENVDPEKYAEMIKAAKEKQANMAKDEGNWEKREAQIKEDLAEEYGTKIKTAEARSKILNAALENELVDKAAIAGISKHTQEIDLLLPHVRGQIKMEETDGQFRAVVVDEAGQPRMVPSEADPSLRVAMTIDQLVATQTRTQFPSAFPGSGGTGAGSKGSDTGDKTVKGSISIDKLESPESAEGFLKDLEQLATDKVKVSD